MAKSVVGFTLTSKQTKEIELVGILDSLSDLSICIATIWTIITII